MSATEIHNPDDYFGGCPRCGNRDGYMYGYAGSYPTSKPLEWFVCHKHRTRWEWGSGMTSAWKEWTGQQLATQQAKTETYTVVEEVGLRPLSERLESFREIFGEDPPPGVYEATDEPK